MHDNSTATRLLEPHELAELGPPEAVRLPLELVDPSDSNPRRTLADIDALADSIRDPSIGLLQPILVRRMGERYEVLAGHRRRAAFLLLRDQEPHDPRWRTIPAVVRSAGDEDAYLMLLTSQLHSRSWTAREESAALERLAVDHTLVEVGAIVHRGESWVSKRLRIYADVTLGVLVQTGRMSSGVAEELLVVRDESIRRDYAERAVSEGWSQDHTRGMVRSLRLDKMLAETARRARELLVLLGSVDVSRLPPEATKDLWALQRRIVALGRGAIIPTVAEAEKLAGVNPNARPRGRTNSSLKKRRRTMPPPA